MFRLEIEPQKFFYKSNFCLFKKLCKDFQIKKIIFFNNFNNIVLMKTFNEEKKSFKSFFFNFSQVVFSHKL